MPRYAILFDLDGTLVDSARDIAAALTRLSRSRGGKIVSPETVRPLVSLGAPILVARALGPVAEDPLDDLATFRALLHEAAFDPAVVFADVEWALRALLRAKWRMAVVTNKPQSLAIALLDTHRLRRFFAVVVGGDTVARSKPDPAPLRHALAALDASPDAALFVGDSDVDALAAAALDIPLLLYAGGYGAKDVPAERCAGSFLSFADLPQLVATHR